MARTLAGRLIKGLFCGFPNRGRRVAVFSAFSDESASGDGRAIFLVGGYLASSGAWEDAVDAWQERVLDTPPKIPRLHMIEIRRRKFQEKWGLSVDQAEKKVAMAVDVIVGSGIRAVLSKIHVPHLESALCDPLKTDRVEATFRVRAPDFLCYLAYAYNVLLEIRDSFPNAEKVDFVVSRKHGITEQINGFHEGIRAFLAEHDPAMEHLCGRLIPDDPGTSPALQMADVMCWHMRRFFDAGRISDNNTLKLQRCGIREHEHTRADLEALRHATVAYAKAVHP
jgi:hypothetical protein